MRHQQVWTVWTIHPQVNLWEHLQNSSLNQAYLNSDALSRFPEIELYEAVQAWLRHDRRRWRHTDTIVQSIRFCLMTPANIFEKVSADADRGRPRVLQSGVVAGVLPLSSSSSTGEDVRVLPLLPTAEAGGGPGAQLLPWCQPATSGGDALQPHPLRPPADRRLQGDDRPQYGQQQDFAAATPKGVCPSFCGLEGHVWVEVLPLVMQRNCDP